MTGSWAELPLDRVVRLTGAGTEAIELALEPLPDGAPAVIRLRPQAALGSLAATVSPAGLISEVLAELDAVATGLFPAWLPGAELIDGPGGAGIAAVRALARSTAATTLDFGPFLADLAERSLAGGKPADTTFVDEVRAVGLTRVVATSFARPNTALLVVVPAGLTAAAEHALVTAFEWFAYHGRAGVWFTGAPLANIDRVGAVAVPLSGTNAEEAGSESAELPAVSYPALAGRPHPASREEQALEAALAAEEWAAGRAWNQTHRFGALVNPVVVDLVWPTERCVVEVDGPEHRGELHYESDRRRDVELQLAGYAVLRFTNRQIAHDLDAVVRRIEHLIHTRRIAQREE